MRKRKREVYGKWGEFLVEEKNNSARPFVDPLVKDEVGILDERILA